MPIWAKLDQIEGFVFYFAVNFDGTALKIFEAPAGVGSLWSSLGETRMPSFPRIDQLPNYIIDDMDNNTIIYH